MPRLAEKVRYTCRIRSGVSHVEVLPPTVDQPLGKASVRYLLSLDSTLALAITIAFAKVALQY